MNIPEGCKMAASHPGHPVLSSVELLKLSSDIAQAIERCSASVELTNAVTLASDMYFHLRRYIERGAAPVPPSVESLLENWTPIDQQAFAKFRDEHFPGEMSSYAIQSLGSAWKDGQANASPEAPQYTGTGSDSLDCILGVGGFASFGPLDAQPAAHLTIPGALEWDGDNGTHGADGESRVHGESVRAVDALLLDGCVEHRHPGYGGGYFGTEVVKLYTGPDAGEVESLRSQLANTEQSRRSFFDLSQDLEKRLAERDALLLEASTWIKQNSFGGCDAVDLWERIDASAEPTKDHSVDAAEMAKVAEPKPYAAMSEAEADEFLSSFGGGSGNKAKRRIAAIEKAKTKTCIECDQPYCHGVCVERGDQDYDRDQAAKGGDDA
jgi:hypothetical protein